MKCDAFETELAMWMERSWEQPHPVLPQKMAQHVETCPECAARSHAALVLVSPPSAVNRAPATLRMQIMNRIVAESREINGRFSGPQSVRQGTSRGHRVGWLAAAAAALILTTSLATVVIMRSRPGNQVEVHLVLEAPTARNVSVVGDWNAWEPGSQPLADGDGDGRWEITIKVKSGGEYRYQFVVDEEQWISDPAARMQVGDGFGGTNSVLDI